MAVRTTVVAVFTAWTGACTTWPVATGGLTEPKLASAEAVPRCESGLAWSLEPRWSSSSLGPDFVPDALAFDGPLPSGSLTTPAEIDAEKLRQAILGSGPVPQGAGRGAVCLATEASSAEPFVSATGRIHRVLGLRPSDPALGSAVLVLYSSVPLPDHLVDQIAPSWHVSVVDDDYRVITTTTFTNYITDDRTRDVVQTRVTRDGASLSIEVRYGLDCDGHKHDQSFTVTLAYDPVGPCLELRSHEDQSSL